MTASTRIDRDALARTLDQQLHVITRKQAAAAGLTKHALQHRLRLEGPWRVLLPGVYLAATGTPTLLQEEMAPLPLWGPGRLNPGVAGGREPHPRGPATQNNGRLIPASRKHRDTA